MIAIRHLCTPVARAKQARIGRPPIGRDNPRGSIYTARVEIEKRAEPKTTGIDAAYLKQLNLLQKSGALDDLAALRRENHELDLLINDAAALFAKTSIEDMLGFVITRFLERFIPSKLVFIIEPPRGDRLDQYSFSNLQPSDALVSEGYYGPLKSFFLASPYPIDFAEIEGRLGAGTFGPDFRSFEPDILFPLSGIGGLYGIVIFGRKVVGSSYSELERMYADRIIRFLSIGIQNSLHHESSITDSKTGLYNHQHFIRTLEQEIARVGRHGKNSGLIMLDVDHFKRFNDSYGHLAGDEVLAHMAETIKKAIRREDVASRFGGEEFCILVVECDGPTLIEVAERIRTSIETMEISFEGLSLTVTASLGCCFIRDGAPEGPDELIGRADKALYLSKTGGRNRTTLFRAGLLDKAIVLRTKTGAGG